MPAAPRARPEDHFSPAQWQRLTAKSRWRGLWLVAHAWGVIGAAMLVGARWPWLIPVCVMVVGTRQLGLAILMHDAAHGLLHPNRAVNDWVGHWLCAPTLKAYRPYHLQHHRYVQQAEDPDLVLSAPFPISPASLRRKMWRDLSGQTFFKQRIQPLWQQLRGRGSSAAGGDGETAFAGRDLRFLLANALGFLVFAAAGWWWLWLVLWLLPMASWLPLVTRLRNIAEHALVPVDQPDPLRQARTTRASWLERAFIAPYWVNFHSEHHLFTQLPCWQLPEAHALLRAAGTTARMEVQPGYLAVMRLAAPR